MPRAVSELELTSVPVKDPSAAHPVPLAWRPTLQNIVEAFVAGDFGLERGVALVAPVSAATAKQIRDYVADYGATLAPLPEETWKTSGEVAWEGDGSGPPTRVIATVCG